MTGQPCEKQIAQAKKDDLVNGAESLLSELDKEGEEKNMEEEVKPKTKVIITTIITTIIIIIIIIIIMMPQHVTVVELNVNRETKYPPIFCTAVIGNYIISPLSSRLRATFYLNISNTGLKWWLYEVWISMIFFYFFHDYLKMNTVRLLGIRIMIYLGKT